MINSYLEQAQLNVEQQLINAELEKLEQYLNSNAAPAVRWQYQIPELGEGGACSLFGYLQDEPFNLNDYVSQNTQITAKLAQLQLIVDYVIENTQLDWYGIYQNTATPEGEQLLKLAYFGEPSRPLFPLTAEFATATSGKLLWFCTKPDRERLSCSLELQSIGSVKVLLCRALSRLAQWTATRSGALGNNR